MHGEPILHDIKLDHEATSHECVDNQDLKRPLLLVLRNFLPLLFVPVEVPAVVPQRLPKFPMSSPGYLYDVLSLFHIYKNDYKPLIDWL